VAFRKLGNWPCLCAWIARLILPSQKRASCCCGLGIKVVVKQRVAFVRDFNGVARMGVWPAWGWYTLSLAPLKSRVELWPKLNQSNSLVYRRSAILPQHFGGGGFDVLEIVHGPHLHARRRCKG